MASNAGEEETPFRAALRTFVIFDLVIKLLHRSETGQMHVGSGGRIASSQCEAKIAELHGSHPRCVLGRIELRLCFSILARAKTSRATPIGMVAEGRPFHSALE